MQQNHTQYGLVMAVWQLHGVLYLTLPIWHSSKQERCTQS
jgi:hypothetical protein